jgi:hypothetical protein
MEEQKACSSSVNLSGTLRSSIADDCDSLVSKHPVSANVPIKVNIKTNDVLHNLGINEALREDVDGRFL